MIANNVHDTQPNTKDAVITETSALHCMLKCVKLPGYILNHETVGLRLRLHQ